MAKRRTKPSKPPAQDASSTPSDPAPDSAEENVAELVDDPIPTRSYQMLPMVGIGGSAGSIPALQQFFRDMPPESGMVFVVILHLSPDYESSLAALLQRSTAMPVEQVHSSATVRANHVYVIPPGKSLISADGHLKLSDLQSEHGKRVAVDVFFRTLADTHGPHSTAIVLSGADSDGSIGIKRVKERGGLTIAQDPDEAGHSGMPRAAIATGMVDWVLRIAEMPERLVKYHRQGSRLKLPPEQGPQPARPVRASTNDDEAALRNVLTYLRSRTGRDFSYYKRATIVRRIARRMQVNNVDDVPEYLTFLRTHPGEAGALLQDLLISVTNFFRDRDAFDDLERRIPELFKDKGPSDHVRVWVPACATGEEAYSVAMLLAEHARTLDAPPQLQIFATDLDEEVIRVARDAIYPESIAADVSEDRLRRFFAKEHRGYRVRREIRECVLFAVHDLLKDSPFSKIDLISCRNVLIYLDREAQKRAFETFHFALRPHGLLFLGMSESAEDSGDLFSIVDKKHRIYAHRNTARIGLPMPIGASTLTLAIQAQEAMKERPTVPTLPAMVLPPEGPAPVVTPRQGQRERVSSWSELHFKLLERFGPPSVIVNQDQDIVHLSNSAGRFLQFGGGELTRNLLRAVHPMLRLELRAALYRTVQTGEAARAVAVPVDLDGQRYVVDMQVAPAGDIAPDFVLITFDAKPLMMAAAHEEAPTVTADPLAPELEREIEHLKATLRDTIEQYEAGTEELKASNEELQAMNEELRSASEELESSREELQSINEELTTVNFELKSKIDELGHANSDLHNLIASTSIATLFLDRSLQIMRFTPSAVALFNLIPGDVGRPLGHLKPRLQYPELTSDAASVMQRLIPVDREVRDEQGRWYLARLLPYRTLDDHINGVVLNFVDISERKDIEERLRKSQERRDLALDAAGMGAWDYDLIGNVCHFDARAREMYNLAAETLDHHPEGVAAIVHPDDVGPMFEAIRHASDVKGDARYDIDYRIARGDGTYRWLRAWGKAEFEGEGAARRAVRIVGISRDITRERESDQAALQSRERSRVRAQLRMRTQTFLLSFTDALRALTDASEIVRTAERLVGEHFGVASAIYARLNIEDGLDAYIADHGYTAPGYQSVDGRFRLADFPGMDEQLRSGRTLDIADVTADVRLDERDRAAYAAGDIAALMIAPQVVNGRVLAIFAIHDPQPRAWTPDDIALIEDVTERTWAAIEREHAATALRESEERYRSLTEQLETRVRERTSEVRTLFTRLVTAQEEERSRIARDIHDQIGQQITALRMNLETLRSQAEGRTPLVEQTERTQRLAEELDQGIDFLTWQLRPAALEHLGLSAALQNLATGWSERFLVPAQLMIEGVDEVRLSRDVEANLYRIAQEALHNVAKHAQATRVELYLTQRNGMLVLLIEDDGRGFHLDSNRQADVAGGMGLMSMRERAALVGGGLEIESAVGRGTSIYVRIPYSDQGA